MEKELFNMYQAAVMNDMHQLTPKMLLDLSEGFKNRQFILSDIIRDKQQEGK